MQSKISVAKYMDMTGMKIGIIWTATIQMIPTSTENPNERRIAS